MRAVHLVVRGRVQGVGYRQNAARQARRLGLVGWVRNRVDTTVEAVVQGAEPAVQQFIDWSHRGPPHARVERVDVTDAPVDVAVAAFEVRATV